MAQRLGIIGAMPQEIDLITADLETEHIERIAGRSYHVGTFAGSESVVVFSRWGKVAAAMTATVLIERFGVDLIIFTGVAGAVSRSLEVGDVVVADRLLQHDFDVSPTGMFAKFEIPLLGISYFPVDGRLVELAKDAAEQYLAEDTQQSKQPPPAPFLRQAQDRHFGKEGEIHRVYVGTIASGDQFIAHPDRLEELRSAIPDLLCVEMEGAAVAQVCHEYSVPFLVIRTISDKADHSAPVDFVSFIQDVARKYSHGIVKRLVPLV
jgi:adenosylhomocysteine nucleosidase